MSGWLIASVLRLTTICCLQNTIARTRLDDQVDTCVGLRSDPSAAGRVLVLTGTAGSGKSTYVRTPQYSAVLRSTP